MSTKKRITLVAISLVLITVASSQGIGWALVNAQVRHAFPNVKRISAAELTSWLDDRTRPAPVLLDVRTRAEFEVSHLRNAEWIEPEAPVSAVRHPPDTAIVTYCSVGYRSGAFAEKLRAAGYANVVNLEGSIFCWANEGRPVYRGEEKVEQVHPYNRTWGLLLRKKYRASMAAKAAPVSKIP